MERDSFKKIMIQSFKKDVVKMFRLLWTFCFYYLIVIIWLKLMVYLTTEFPEREMDLEYLGLFGMGYVLISYLSYMSKTSDSINKENKEL